MKIGDKMTSLREKINNIYEEEEKMASALKEEEWTKTDTKITIIIGIIVLMLAFIFIPNPLIKRLDLMATTPSQTLYLTYNMFPVQANGTINNRPAIFSFNGVPLANGTECISYVQIYPFNYTSQKFNSQPLTVNDPVELAEVYYNLGNEYNTYYNKTFNIQTPSNSTLLCPSVVKVVK